MNSIDQISKYILKHLSRLGGQIVYSVLLLMYAYQRPEIPKWAKSTMLGAVGYLISPLDSLPDLTPLIGYTDDLGVLSFALVTVACYINDEVREKAKNHVLKLMPSVDPSLFSVIDEKL